MTEQDFQILIMLGEIQNITRAADQLFVTQSALSKRIAAIEQELGTSLMIRSRSGIHFTPEGEIVLKYAKEASSRLALMRSELDAAKEYISGTLNAGVSINFAHYTLPDILAEYRKEYPHVNTHITTGQSRHLYMLMMNGQLDIAIIRGEYEWKEAQILLSREPICAICSEKDKGRPLSEIPYIGRGTDAVFERELAQWMRENNLRAEHDGFFVDSITTCVEIVSRGVGWAVVPEICLKNFTGDIRPLKFANGEPFERSTRLIYTNEASKLPQVQAFVETVRKGSQ